MPVGHPQILRLLSSCRCAALDRAPAQPVRGGTLASKRGGRSQPDQANFAMANAPRLVRIAHANTHTPAATCLKLRFRARRACMHGARSAAHAARRPSNKSTAWGPEQHKQRGTCGPREFSDKCENHHHASVHGNLTKHQDIQRPYSPGMRGTRHGNGHAQRHAARKKGGCVTIRGQA